MQSILRKESIAMVTSPQHFSDWKRLGQGQHPSQLEKPNQEGLVYEMDRRTQSAIAPSHSGTPS